MRKITGILTVALTARRTSRPKRARFSSEPPYSSVRRVDLDAVEAGLRGARRGRREGVGGGADVVERHFLRHDGLVGHLEHRMRDGGGRERGLAADVDAGVPAAVAELD